MSDVVRRELVSVLPRLRRFARGLAGSHDEGDDLVQIACERALTRAGQWQEGTRFDSWIFRIVHNAWIDRLRSRKRRGEVSEPVLLEALPGRDGAAELDSRRRLERVRGAVAGLPEEQRSAIMLIGVEGLSYQAAADLVGVPIGTMMSRLSRARVALARTMGGDVP